MSDMDLFPKKNGNLYVSKSIRRHLYVNVDVCTKKLLVVGYGKHNRVRGSRTWENYSRFDSQFDSRLVSRFDALFRLSGGFHLLVQKLFAWQGSGFSLHELSGPYYLASMNENE